VRVFAGDRVACGVPAETAAHRALSDLSFINTLLATVAVSAIVARIGADHDERSSESINLKN
jgi:hypothetical protein